MLRTVRNKLNDRSGASLMVGLLFFVTCAVVGSVILAAASSSMGRMSGLSKTDQNRYAVQSAAKVVKDQIGKADYTNVSVIPQDGTTSDDENGFGTQYGSGLDANAALSDVFAAMAEQKLKQYWEDGTDNANGTVQSLWENAVKAETGRQAGTEKQNNESYNTTDVQFVPRAGQIYNPVQEQLKFSVTASGSSDPAEGSQDVYVSVVMNDDFTIAITVSNERVSSDSSTDVHLSAKPYIGMTFDQISGSGTGGDLRRITTSISWTVNEENDLTSPEDS